MRPIDFAFLFLFLTSILLGCENPNEVEFSLYGFGIKIDIKKFTLQKDTTDISVLQNEYKILGRLIFHEIRNENSLVFTVYDTTSSRHFSYYQKMKILQAKMSDSDLKPLSAFPISCDSSHNIKYCFLIDTVNVVPNYITGVVENSNQNQIKFSYYFADKQELMTIQRDLRKILANIHFKQR